MVWARSSDQPTRWRLIRPHVKETGTCEPCHVFTWLYAIHFIPTNMVQTRVGGNLRMRKQNTKTTVSLDVVPESRTKRFPPRFRPVGRFSELRFRDLSSPTGREGEISRPLDHMRQIPFIHSARLIHSTNFYIYRTVFKIFSPCGTLGCVLMWSIFNNCAGALARTLISRLRPLVELLLFFIRYVVVTTGAKQMAFTYAHCWNYQIVHFVSFHFIHVFLCLFLCPFFWIRSKYIFF